MKYLIVGLGNVGAKYENTRHNIGFNVLDALVGASNINFNLNRHAFTCELNNKNKTLFLVKPTTYMNLSGKAVSYWMQQIKIPLENLLIVVDDIALPFGAVRLRSKGSDAGHNGLANINLTLGTQNYSRLRFGIGNDFPKGYQAEYVLSEWNEEQKKLLPERIEIMKEAIISFVMSGVAITMNKYNKL